MVGGRPSKALQERLFSFEFPESPGALLEIPASPLAPTGIFHCSTTAATAPTMVGYWRPSSWASTEPDFETRLNELGYECHDETHNPAFRFSRGLVVGKNFPESINKRAPCSRFCAQTPSSNGVCSSLRSRIITLLRTGSGLFSSTTSGSSAAPHPRATIEHHRFVPADGGVNRSDC